MRYILMVLEIKKELYFFDFFGSGSHSKLYFYLVTHQFHTCMEADFGIVFYGLRHEREAIQSLASTNRLIRNQNYSSIIENQESQKSNPTQLKSNQYMCTVKLLCIPLL